MFIENFHFLEKFKKIIFIVDNNIIYNIKFQLKIIIFTIIINTYANFVFIINKKIKILKISIFGSILVIQNYFSKKYFILFFNFPLTKL